eukprot:1039500-Amphidinium_carterae.1
MLPSRTAARQLSSAKHAIQRVPNEVALGELTHCNDDENNRTLVTIRAEIITDYIQKASFDVA